MKRSTDRAASVWRDTAMRKMRKKPNASHKLQRRTSVLPKTNSLALSETKLISILDMVIRKSTSAKLNRKMLPGSFKRWYLKIKEARMKRFQQNATTKKIPITAATAGVSLRSSCRSIQEVGLVTCVELIESFKQVKFAGVYQLAILAGLCMEQKWVQREEEMDWSRHICWKVAKSHYAMTESVPCSSMYMYKKKGLGAGWD